MDDDNVLSPETTVENPTLPAADNEAVSNSAPDIEAKFAELWSKREAELERKFEARLSEQQRAAQRKADSARDNAVRKQQQFLKEYAPVLQASGVQLDEESLARITNTIREKEFWSAETAPEAQTTQPNLVTADALRRYIADKKLNPDQVDYSRFVGLTDTDPRGYEFYSMVDKAVAAQSEAAKARDLAARQSAAKKVADTKAGFGGTSTLNGSAGAASSVSSLEEEMNKLLKSSTGDAMERQRNRERANEIEKELRRLGRWGSNK